ncbi:uncharacterized protein LOC143190794 [Rhynchophorus ferrugineus]|uniref:uncharacterized protein LOC143190794 n=1 Tax=Rhynchophorus ferrugineus TaxID=354439 RepID=UPI003FCC6F32
MNLVCSHCKALKYKNEANGLCCANGIGTDSIHFLTHIQQYNNCFQMTSFGATNAVRENFMPTFKIQGQIYHRAGSLLPVSDSDNKFLQIYFMGNSPQEIDLRCAHNNLVKRSIVEQLQTLFHQHNQLIILFKTALDLMPSDNHKIVIRADKTPAGQHTRRFNAPTIDEVAIVVVGENLESRDIVLHRRNFQLQPIKETHRSYDALQYPIIFWQGEDGYDLSIKMINPITGSETNKKVSSMNYYSYRLMIRENADNRILKCRRLYHKYVDDMYVKIETERLTFIRLNQTKLRSEEYIHLRDAINTDGNAQNIVKKDPSLSERYRRDYIKEAIFREYGVELSDLEYDNFLDEMDLQESETRRKRKKLKLSSESPKKNQFRHHEKWLSKSETTEMLTDSCQRETEVLAEKLIKYLDIATTEEAVETKLIHLVDYTPSESPAESRRSSFSSDLDDFLNEYYGLIYTGPGHEFNVPDISTPETGYSSDNNLVWDPTIGLYRQIKQDITISTNYEDELVYLFKTKCTISSPNHH